MADGSYGSPPPGPYHRAVETGPRDSLVLQVEKAILVGILTPESERDPRDPLGELRGLAETAGLNVVGELVQRRERPRGRTYLGKGKVEELSALAAALGATVAVFDNELAPSQIQALEEDLERKLKIIDRSELILDIFANRAVTRQAQLQVEIAQLEYTAPRLRAMWSHLGQVTGGAPVGVGTRGPGEQQIEIDRRLVQRRLLQLQRELADVQARKTREVLARRAEHFTVGLVGYTNAGKSSIFNALTAGGAYAADKPFATLATRVERWNVGAGEEVMLSDTVGFIRDLPHHLVASFRSTLEDAINAHALIIVLDVADPHAIGQWQTVIGTLEEIGATTQPRILVLNKIDRWRELPDESRERRRSPRQWQSEADRTVATSAVTGEGLDELAATVRELMSGELETCEISVPLENGKAVDLIERLPEVLERRYEGDRGHFRVRLGRRHAERLAAARGLEIDGRPAGEAIAAIFAPERKAARRRIPPHAREPLPE
jgi:GTP-binding protein HflX